MSSTEAKVDAAIETLTSSTDNGINVTPGDQENTFVLDSQSYFDLQAYCMTGKDFPQSEAAFNNRITKQAFKKLTDIDSKIYDETYQTMVGIGTTCDAFYNNHLGRLLLAAGAAMSYAETATDKLTGKGVNLHDQLEVLMDERYKGKADIDEEFLEAKAVAALRLRDLKNDADTKKKEVDDIVLALTLFKEATMAYEKPLKDLKNKYLGRPENDKTKGVPYLQYLNADLAAMRTKLSSAIVESKAKYNDWIGKTAQSYVFMSVPYYGWVLANDAKELRKTYNELSKNIDTYRKDLDDEFVLISNVSMLIEQCSTIGPKMTAAVKALGKLSEVFGKQSACYSVLSTYFHDMEVTDINYSSLKTRTKAITSSVEKTVAKLQQLSDLAKQFQEAINKQTKLTL